MRVVREELFTVSKLPTIIVVTTNSTIRHNSALIMGRGAAKQARDMIPGIDLECGKLMQEVGRDYGFLVVRSPFRVDDEGHITHVGFGIFQVKHHYASDATLDLIEMSVERLAKWANQHKYVDVRMNFPGIGCGRLDARGVLPLLQALPGNVTICRR